MKELTRENTKYNANIANFVGIESEAPKKVANENGLNANNNIVDINSVSPEACQKVVEIGISESTSVMNGNEEILQPTAIYSPGADLFVRSSSESSQDGDNQETGKCH